MFALLLYVAMIFVFMTILTFCVSAKNKFFRYTFCTISGLLIVTLFTAFAIDLFFYVKGDKVSFEYIKLSESKTLGFFTVNDIYWGVAGDFTEYKMVAKQNEKDMEIRFVETKPDLKDKICAVCYLPISRFVTFVGAPQSDSSGYYDIYKYHYRTYETEVMKYIAVLCIVVFIISRR